MPFKITLPKPAERSRRSKENGSPSKVKVRVLLSDWDIKSSLTEKKAELPAVASSSSIPENPAIRS